jgi:hypothetical protein
MESTEGDTWYVHDDQCEAYVEHEFKVGDIVRMIDDSLNNVKGIGVVKDKFGNTYCVKVITTEQPVISDLLLYRSKQLEKLDEPICISEDKTFDVGDEFEFGNWSVEVVEHGSGRELVLTNDFFDEPSVIKVVDDNVGWFRNGNGTTIYRDEFVRK